MSTTDQDPMPVFTIKGKDMLALSTIKAYREACASYGLHDQAAEVDKAIAEMAAWQRRNVSALKWPDHEHVDASASSH